MSSPIFSTRTVVVLSALILSGAGGALAQGTESAAPENLVPDDVLTGASSQSADGRRAISNYLLSGNPRPQDIASRAVVAINTLRNSGAFTDPAQLIAAADRIAQVATPALCPPKVMQVFVDDNFQLPPTSKGYDFAPNDAPAFEGFEKVTPDDSRLSGGAPRAISRPGNRNLMSDGLVGVNKFITPMENGVHRVLLMTDDLGNEDTYLSPLGGKVIVNGREINIGDHPPESWLKGGVLENPNARPEVTETGVGGQPFTAQRGGGLMVEVEVTNGQLEVEMIPPGGGERQTYLTGAVVEPVTAPESAIGRYVDAANAVIDTEECLELEAEITTALADLLEEIEPAAGPELELLDLPEPVIEDEAESSPA